MSTLVKTEKDIEILREGGKKLAHVMEHVLSSIAPGVSADALDKAAEEAIQKEGAAASFKGYAGGAVNVAAPYPASICVSVNDEVVHGIPSEEKIIREGDIVSIDIGLIWKERFTDMARTVIVGTGDENAKKLVSVTKESLDCGIRVVKEGAHIGDIGEAIEECVKSFGYGIIKALVGHGVGYELHEEPQIPNFNSGERGIELKAGMVLALEPMITEKGIELATDDDNWTIRTVNHARAAHFEDTVVVTKKGAEILTR